MKNIHPIPTLILSAAFVAMGASAVRAQAVVRPVSSALRAAEESVAKAGPRMIKLNPHVRISAAARDYTYTWRLSQNKQIPVVPMLQSKVNEVAAAGVAQIKAQKLAERIRWGIGVLAFRNEILKGYHLPEEYLEGFFMRRIFPYQQKPSYIPDAAEGTLYRGMLITPEELSVILREGFSPATSTWNTGAKKPAVSFSSSSVEASHYIFQQGFKKDGLGVVFKVRKHPRMELGESSVYNSTKTIYYSYEDIPAEDIVEVLIRGEYGLVSLKDILERAKNGKITPHTDWTGQFGGILR